MPPKKNEDLQPNPNSKTQKGAAKGSSKQAQSPAAGQERPTSKSQVPSAKTSTAKAGSGQSAPYEASQYKWRVQGSEDVVTFVGMGHLGEGKQGEVNKARLFGSEVGFAVKQVEIFQMVTSKDKLVKKRLVELYKEVANQRKCSQASPLVLPVFAWTVRLYEGAFDSTMDLRLLSPVCLNTVKNFIEKDRGISDEFRPYVKVFTLQLSEVVAVLHKLRVVHRDLLPQNIYIHKDAQGYRIVVGDFGMSIDFDDPDQAAWAEKKSERKLQVHDLYSIAAFYLAMEYGEGGVVSFGATPTGRLTENSRNKLFERVAHEPRKTHKERKTHKRNERCFVLAMLDSDGVKEPIVPAKNVKLLPFFQEDNTKHPVWALDLEKLEMIGDDVKTAFAERNIVWTDINADVLEKAVLAAQMAQEFPPLTQNEGLVFRKVRCPADASRPVSYSLVLENTGSTGILYKVKCTSNARVRITDCAGILGPGEKGKVGIFYLTSDAETVDRICAIYTLVGPQWLTDGASAFEAWQRASAQMAKTRTVMISDGPQFADERRPKVSAKCRR